MSVERSVGTRQRAHLTDLNSRVKEIPGVRTYVAEERRYPGGQEDHFEIPSPEVKGARTEDAYTMLSEDGLISPEGQTKGGDVLIKQKSCGQA